MQYSSSVLSRRFLDEVSVILRALVGGLLLCSVHTCVNHLACTHYLAHMVWVGFACCVHGTLVSGVIDAVDRVTFFDVIIR